MCTPAARPSTATTHPAPLEDAALAPNSHYAVSKVAAANLIYFYGKKLGLPCVNLRLYSVYGPIGGRIASDSDFGATWASKEPYPEFVHPDISRDFVYADDAVEAFVDVALNLTEPDYGESFNIGTGRKTTIGEVAELAKKLFAIPTAPVFAMPSREWDMSDWYANIEKVKARMGWEPRTTFQEGLQKPPSGSGHCSDRDRLSSGVQTLWPG